MKIFRRNNSWLRVAATLSAIAWSLPLAAAQPAALTNSIPPTVTAAMGDVGGKIFGRTPAPAKTRRYYIAAEPQLWDYAPEGRDPICGKPFPPQIAAQRSGTKLRYIEYTDDTFTTRVIANPRLGVLGPVLRGVVGDYLAVTFLNRTAQPLSMHPHGVKYDKDNEGAYYQPRPGLGAAVGPSAKFTYVWQLDENSGPLPGEASSKGWLYHSHVKGDVESRLGLIGSIIVTDPKRARPDGTPVDVDREMAALFMIFDESGLGEEEREAAEHATTGVGLMPPMPWAKVKELTEQGQRSAINGLIYGNLPGLEMNEGERVRWYLFALGSEADSHSAHWHGMTVVEDGRRRTDVIELLPASMKVADMVADNPGTWLFHCHVAEHMEEGMFARFIVHPNGSKGAAKENAFFGARQSADSLKIKRAEVQFDPSIKGAKNCEIKLTGVVSVFDAFSVFTQVNQIQIGKTSVQFKPDRKGAAKTETVTFQATNAGQFGVVYGGLMEFELTLRGTDWLSELRTLGLKDDSAAGSALGVPITLRVGAATHAGTAQLVLPAN